MSNLKPSLMSVYVGLSPTWPFSASIWIFVVAAWPSSHAARREGKKKEVSENAGKTYKLKTEGSCKPVKEKEAREKASDNTRRFPSRTYHCSLTASTALSATLVPHALCAADLGAPTPPVAPPAPSQAALPLRGDRPSASRRPCSATSLHGRRFVASGCRR